MNTWYSRIDKPDRPDFVLFDLDPTPETPWQQTIEVGAQGTCQQPAILPVRDLGSAFCRRGAAIFGPEGARCRSRCPARR